MPENCPAEVQPLDQSGEIKTPAFINLNYTNQDFFSLKNRLVNFINERFGEEGTVLPNTFNDLVESSIAIMLIENWAFIGDTLSFKMDQIANEIFIDTVSELENIFRLSRLVGFKPQPPIAARSLWTVSINNALLSDVIIPTPLALTISADDGSPLAVELFAADANNEPLFNDDIVIPTGSISNSSVIGLEGVTVIETFGGTGEVSQTITLGRFPVIFDSITLAVDGATWDEVDFFTDSQPRREYRVEFDSEFVGFIIFGNNRAGIIPSAGSEIEVTYRTGGGTRGNIVTGFVETQTLAAVPGLEFNVPINLTNFTRGEFGSEGDSIEDVRRKLPAFLRTQDRAVTGLDYKTLADQFATPFQGQIGKATAVLRNHGCAGNVIDLYILALDDIDDLVIASNELKVSLNEELNEKKMLTDFICIRDGVVISTDVSIEVIVDKIQRKFEPEIRERIDQRIDIFFSLNNWDFGKTLRVSDLLKDLSDLKEVDEFVITFTTDDEDNSGSIVTADFFEIIRPDDIDITFIFD